MKVIISPAKKLNEKNCDVKSESTIPFAKESEVLVKKLKNFSQDEIISLMGVSTSIANLNKQRFNDWSYPFNGSSKPAVFMFDGAVYNELDVETLKKSDILYMQDNLRILSGLYGILKPLDKIMPYRLEMGTKLAVDGHKNLYEFWGDKITKQLLSECSQDDIILNLASNEYSKVLDLKSFSNVITPIFKDYKNDKLKVISFFAKKARGSFARFVMTEKPNKIDELLNFNGLGYQFSEITSKNEIVFTR